MTKSKKPFVVAKKNTTPRRLPTRKVDHTPLSQLVDDESDSNTERTSTQLLVRNREIAGKGKRIYKKSKTIYDDISDSLSPPLINRRKFNFQHQRDVAAKNVSTDLANLQGSQLKSKGDSSSDDDVQVSELHAKGLLKKPSLDGSMSMMSLGLLILC
jgi:hypothetical protein